jgi:hypothetical protein
MLSLYLHGVRVPEDVSVVGFDDVRMSAYTTPPLTTVHLPASELGESAAEMVLELLAGREPGQARFTTELVIRKSARACGRRTRVEAGEPAQPQVLHVDDESAQDCDFDPHHQGAETHRVRAAVVHPCSDGGNREGAQEDVGYPPAFAEKSPRQEEHNRQANKAGEVEREQDAHLIGQDVSPKEHHVELQVQHAVDDGEAGDNRGQSAIAQERCIHVEFSSSSYSVMSLRYRAKLGTE